MQHWFQKYYQNSGQSCNGLLQANVILKTFKPLPGQIQVEFTSPKFPTHSPLLEHGLQWQPY